MKNLHEILAAYGLTLPEDKKIERKYAATYINTAIGSETAVYRRIGKGLEEYSVEMSANIEKTQDIIDDDKILDDYNTDVVTVKLWEAAVQGSFPAVKELAVIEVVSYGGDTTGYQIPYNLHFTGVKTQGFFNPTTKAFSETAPTV